MFVRSIRISPCSHVLGPQLACAAGTPAPAPAALHERQSRAGSDAAKVHHLQSTCASASLAGLRSFAADRSDAPHAHVRRRQRRCAPDGQMAPVRAKLPRMQPPPRSATAHARRACRACDAPARLPRAAEAQPQRQPASRVQPCRGAARSRRRRTTRNKVRASTRGALRCASAGARGRACGGVPRQALALTLCCYWHPHHLSERLRRAL